MGGTARQAAGSSWAGTTACGFSSLWTCLDTVSLFPMANPLDKRPVLCVLSEMNAALLELFQSRANCPLPV